MKSINDVRSGYRILADRFDEIEMDSWQVEALIRILSDAWAVYDKKDRRRSDRRAR